MKLAIKGHPERGKEVIKLLESFGGEELPYRNWSGAYKNNLYYICKDGYIDYVAAENPLYQTTHKIYTLEEFEKLYPLKVGDKVYYTGISLFSKKDNKSYTITKLYWDETMCTVSYILDNQWQCSHKWIKPMKQKELKDYLKPGYVVEFADGVRCILTQDVHGNVFGVEIHNDQHWTSLSNLSNIVAVYQITSPSNLHYAVLFDSSTKKVWEKPKEVELTMQQIADKFGIDVNQLKIKK